jgi:hypothetical protein
MFVRAREIIKANPTYALARQETVKHTSWPISNVKALLASGKHNKANKHQSGSP